MKRGQDGHWLHEGGWHFRVEGSENQPVRPTAEILAFRVQASGLS